SGQVTEYPVDQGTFPTMITTGPDGNVWFTEEIGNAIVRLVPGNPPTMKAFPDPTDGALPWDINPGPDGKLWFTELAGRHVSKISVSGRITQYLIPGDQGIDGIAAGPDGRMWFTENDTAHVGSITVSGNVRPIYDTGSYPFGITAGPGGNMWYCVGFGDAIGRVRLH